MSSRLPSCMDHVEIFSSSNGINEGSAIRALDHTPLPIQNARRTGKSDRRVSPYPMNIRSPYRDDTSFCSVSSIASVDPTSSISSFSSRSPSSSRTSSPKASSPPRGRTSSPKASSPPRGLSLQVPSIDIQALSARAPSFREPSPQLGAPATRAPSPRAPSPQALSSREPSPRAPFSLASPPRAPSPYASSSQASRASSPPATSHQHSLPPPASVTYPRANNIIVLSQTIPKPPGEVGRPGRGGYNLKKILGWPKEDYDNVKEFVKTLVNSLDCTIPFTEQSFDDLSSIRQQAIKKFDFLNKYQKHWVVDDFIRCRLKYQKTSHNRRNAQFDI
ncbi:hypothetical protein F5876DRAFT_80554 [Lentinula aff. lateritia]|uniref:Uncharacterized protein n=1 Tax=Lentinula aff. lateritia TaxID=2804960 RepID=A0ACC1TPC2_9AGAR|nr:hypothetical protein F5876DRAFT_80554 [Lentinula aff. lateritia]